jgi:predicted deacylase
MDFQAIEFGRAGDRPHVLFTGGVHGDEYEPMAALRRLARELSGRKIAGRITIIPVANEEAFRLGSRTAGDGLDLARTFPGRPDGSITERIAADLAPRIGSADYYVDLHTGGERLQVHPLAGYMLHPDPGVLEAQRRLARAFGLPIIWGTSPLLDGRSLSVARDANVPAIYAEYLGGGCDRRGVDAYVRGCLNVLAELGVVEDQPRTASLEPLIIEDDRPGSGHMQVRNPSPRAGFFEALVKLGDRVRVGQALGVVTDPIGGEVSPVPADCAGIVLVLRRLPRIEIGESVGVVLEIEGMPRPAAG